MYHWGWWMGMMMAVVWFAVWFGIWLIVRNDGSGSREGRPDEILAQRFARGELSADEYEGLRRVLAKR